MFVATALYIQCLAEESAGCVGVFISVSKHVRSLRHFDLGLGIYFGYLRVSQPTTIARLRLNLIILSSIVEQELGVHDQGGINSCSHTSV